MTRQWARDRSEERQPEHSCVEPTGEPSVWYCIPSASKERATESLSAWGRRGYHTAVLLDDSEDGVYVSGVDLIVPVRRYSGYFRSVNALARMVLSLDQNCIAVVTGGDDIFPDPSHDPIEIAAQCYAAAGDYCWVMQPDGDDLPGTTSICGSPWFSPEWIRRAYGGHGPMPEFYTQFFGDTELRAVAARLGCFQSRPDLTQRHEHWTRGRPKAPHQVANESKWGADSRTFRCRDVAGFPGSGLLIAAPPVLATSCDYDPRPLLGAPIGMFHCPYCGAMVVGGMPHPPDDVVGPFFDPNGPGGGLGGSIGPGSPGYSGPGGDMGSGSGIGEGLNMPSIGEGRNDPGLGEYVHGPDSGPVEGPFVTSPPVPDGFSLTLIGSSPPAPREDLERLDANTLLWIPGGKTKPPV